MNSYCSVMDDAAIMEMKIKGILGVSCSCANSAFISIIEIRRRVKVQGNIELLTHTMEYANSLEGCEACWHFKGEYPTWEEVQRR